MDRIAALTEILTANPEDSFARYGLAMEYSKAGDVERALAEFKTLLEKNPDYTPGYFMAAQTLASGRAGRRSQAHAGRWHQFSPAHRQPARAVGDDGHAGRAEVIEEVRSQIAEVTSLAARGQLAPLAVYF